MAEQSGIAAPFPAPPPFYKHFTKENLTALRQLRKEAGVPLKPSNETTADDERPRRDVDVGALPPELRYLVPPEPPQDGTYNVFGVAIDRNAPEPTLESAGIEQVYPSHPSVRLNPQPHLIALARSLLTSFLSLTGILSVNPELYQEKTQDLQTLMYNMHDLINQYRPHQARETLILLMEERVEKMRRETEAIDEAKKKVLKILQDLQTNAIGDGLPNIDEGPTFTGTKTAKDPDEARRSRQREALRALEDELG